MVDPDVFRMREAMLGRFYRPVGEVRKGDRLDLHEDYYEYAVVHEIEREPDCIVLYTSQGSFAFPPDHFVEVAS